MVKVIEEKPVPKAEITCTNCKSILEYGNADLYKDFSRDYSNCSSLYYVSQHWYLHCPVCGCKISANWI